ncbi:fgf-2 [Clostera anachoreta granulovirus]|uniref:Fgf-2 n=1 Tax=Clostera anachoreta granulovirus TaxID=283675 RepID=F4ZKY4_9BBAC|nr:fgf-2 [Clostera anachoreta granulovirus]AEB00395.1 fgf-2 [Clostera anachoreta granulovirus]
MTITQATIIVTLLTGSLCHNPYTYKVAEDYTVQLYDNELIHDSKSPIHYLKISNKTLGVGFNVGVLNGTVNLYTDTVSRYVRSTPSNSTYYFFKDGDKYYIRDADCNFVCANPCGVVYVSRERVQHQCKFAVNRRVDHYSIYAYNTNGASVTYRMLWFDVKQNVLRARALTDNETINRVDAPFLLRGDPTWYTGRCVPIKRTHQKVLRSNQNMCMIDVDGDVGSMINSTNVDLYVKKDNRRLFSLRIAHDNTTLYDGAFSKTVISPNVYVLRNEDTCRYLCYSVECGVFMGQENSAECTVRIERSVENAFFYLKFVNNNNYLSFNGSVLSTQKATTRVWFDGTKTVGARQRCSAYSRNTRKSGTKLCDTNSSAIASINLIKLFVTMVLGRVIGK